VASLCSLQKKLTAGEPSHKAQRAGALQSVPDTTGGVGEGEGVPLEPSAKRLKGDSEDAVADAVEEVPQAEARPSEGVTPESLNATCLSKL